MGRPPHTRQLPSGLVTQQMTLAQSHLSESELEVVTILTVVTSSPSDPPKWASASL